MIHLHMTNKNIISLLLKENKQDELLSNTEEFIKILGETKYSVIKKVITQFVLELRRSLTKKLDILGYSDDDIKVIYMQLESSTSLSGFKTQLIDLINMVHNALEKNKTNTTKKHYDLISQVGDYVNKNYRDPSISLTQIAEIVNVSPGYLGKIFTNLTDKSLVQYINSVRIENAKLKLTTTDLPAFKIAEEVGILNPTYFTTLFKNMVGCTPSIYRERNKINKY